MVIDINKKTMSMCRRRLQACYEDISSLVLENVKLLLFMVLQLYLTLYFPFPYIMNVVNRSIVWRTKFSFYRFFAKVVC